MSIMLLLFQVAMTDSGSADLLENISGWWVVDDGVMGGVSRGEVSRDDGVLVFSGLLSLDFGGGFSSVRSGLDQRLVGREGLRLTVRGDGRRYQLRLRHGPGFDGVAWRAEFVAPSRWTTLEFAFSDFEPVFRGRSVPNAGPVVPAEVRQVGFLLADGKAGPFRLEVQQLVPLPPARTDR